MRLLYLGLPLGALVLERAGFRPEVAIIGHVTAPGMRRVRDKLGRAGTLLLGKPDLASPEVHALLASARPDATLSFFFPKKISKPVLALAPRGAFGVHPSLLPAYRGPDPYFWSLLRGETRTGVTLHRLEAEYDTGAIIDARTLEISPRWNAHQLARALDRPALELLVSCASRLRDGEILEGVTQPEEGASYAPSPSEQDTVIDWRLPAAQIARLVRACAPYPGALATLGETQVEIVSAYVADEPPPRALDASEAYLTRRGEVAVCCGEDALVLVSVRDAESEDIDPKSLLGLDAHGRAQV